MKDFFSKVKDNSPKIKQTTSQKFVTTNVKPKFLAAVTRAASSGDWA